MGWVTAAIVGSALVGAYASNKAASAQKSAAASASGVSQRQYEQTREDLAPWRQIGGQAINELSALYGLPSENQGGAAGPVIDQQGNPAGDGMVQPPSGGAGNNFDMNGVMTITDPRYIDGELVGYNDPRWAGADPYRAVTPLSGDNALARFGRGGDTQVAHLTPGETVVPTSVMNEPGVQNSLWSAYRARGMDPGRYVVGGSDDSINPATGAREFYAASGSANPGDEAGGFAESGGFGAGDFGDSSGDFGQGPESQDVAGAGGNDEDRNFQTRFRSGGTRWFRGGTGGGGDNASANLPDDYYSRENALARFYESPDYQINFDEGAKALERSAAARGGLFSGNTGTALVRYGQDFGNRLYNQYANRLSAFAGFGQTAATDTGRFGANAAGQQGNALLAGGNAAAQGWIGLANSINAGIGNALYYNQVS